MDELLIRAKIVRDEYHDGCCSCELSHEQVTFEKLLEEHAALLQRLGYVQLDPAKGKIDKKIVDYLKSIGWVHAKTISEREEKKVFEQEYYLLDQTAYYRDQVAKVDIDDLSPLHVEQLAHSGRLAQVVSNKSILPSTQYEKIQNRKKAVEEAKKKLKESAEKRAATKRQKEIEAAKKLLLEAGEISS